MTTGGQPESRNLSYYINCFSQIQVYKNNKRGGEALNQPILLLSVIDAISQGLITENRIFIFDDLIFKLIICRINFFILSVRRN